MNTPSNPTQNRLELHIYDFNPFEKKIFERIDPENLVFSTKRQQTHHGSFNLLTPETGCGNEYRNEQCGMGKFN